MTEELKTKTEVLKELEEVVNDFNGAFGIAKMFKLSIAENESDKEMHLKLTVENMFETGVGHYYAPDHDTKIQALEKAQALQMEKAADGTINTCSITNGSESYSVHWSKKENLGSNSRDFPFADPAPKSEFITDEPPPDGVAVEIRCINGEKVLRYSADKFDGLGNLWVTSSKPPYNNFTYRKTYRSLTTPHRSKDWLD